MKSGNWRWEQLRRADTMVNFFLPDIFDFVIKLNARRSRHFDLSEVIFKCEYLWCIILLILTVYFRK